jgi:hypothetical protein
LAETALTTRLRQNDRYDDVYQKIKSDSDNKELANFTSKAQDAYKKQQLLNSDPNYRAKIFYETQTEQRPCQHCPEYLSLIGEVNKIVEKTKVLDVKKDNQKMIELSRLRFLYYVVKSNEESSDENCREHLKVLPQELNKIKNGKMILAAEEALALPDVDNVQFYEGKGKDVHYYYKGEGRESDNIIEVHVRPNGSAVVRYYKYDSADNLPDLGNVVVNTNTGDKKSENFLELKPEVVTESLVLPTDVKILKAGSLTQINSEVGIRHATDISYNEQATSLGVEDTSGFTYLSVKGKNFTEGKKQAEAVVNSEFDLNKEEGLKLGVSAGTAIEIKEIKKGSADLKQTQNMKLGLTDHNNEYFTIQTVVDNNGLDQINLGNSYKVGDGKVGASLELEQSGDKTYRVNVTDQGYINEGSMRFSNLESGEKIYGAKAGIQIDKKTLLSTDYSHSNVSGNSVAVNFERRISETTSMVLTVNENEKAGTTLMYQFQAKF